MTLSQTYISRKQLLVDNLVAKGVTGYTVNDGLTTLINAVLEIQGGGVRTLTLASDVDILSFADSDEATLTATLLEDGSGVGGESVEFYRYVDGVNDVLIDTQDTNSSGMATGTYTSAGIGDIQVYAKVRTLVSKTFVIEDCNKYWNTISDGDTICNYDLPSSFKLEFSILSSAPTTASSISLLRFNSSSGVWCGKGSSGSANISLFGTTFSSITANTEYNYVLTYQNGVATLTDGTTTKTSSQTLTKLYLLASTTNSKLKEIKIKPL